jgi:hypothetical protein
MATHPSYNTKARRDYQRAYRAAGRDNSNKANNLNKMFVGVDGEGGNIASGYHSYFLLRAGGQSIVPSAGNVRLTTTECLEFLNSLSRDAIYVVYFGDYDVTKILEDLGWTKLEKLMDRSKRQRKDGKGVWPVDYGPFQVDYLPRKEFKVRKEKSRYVDDATGKVRIEYTPWLVINDVGSFFQCRFVEALQKWSIGTDEERRLIGEGKEGRADFTFSDIGEIDPYNALEIKLLQELMEKFRSACVTTGYVPARWQGPGQLAEAMLAKNGVPKSKDIPLLQDAEYDGLITFARNAFYGGRPEIMAIGPVDRAVKQWDINSAYPHAMQSVPCLQHGEWEYIEYAESQSLDSGDIPRTALCYGSFTPVPSNKARFPMWYGLPTRTDSGTIVYPGSGRGWYWAFEIRSARHQNFRVESVWIYRSRCSCTPLAFVRAVYAERLRVGKDDIGIILKLALNSLYGKCVQSIGSPKYANPIWGSFITAFCRALIQDFIHGSDLCQDPEGWCGKDILMIATDSLVTWNERPDVATSTELGGWSVEEHPRGMFIVQPGLYFGSSAKPAKTRGVPRSVIESYEQIFRDKFRAMVDTRRLDSGDVEVPQRMFVGIRYALHRHNLKLLGQWIDFADPETGRTGKRISFDWSSKRAPWPVLDPIPGVHSYLETFPQDGSPDVETLPYKKDIGGLLLRQSLRVMFEDQPDWIPQIELGEMANAELHD